MGHAQNIKKNLRTDYYCKLNSCTCLAIEVYERNIKFRIQLQSLKLFYLFTQTSPYRQNTHTYDADWHLGTVWE